MFPKISSYPRLSLFFFLICLSTILEAAPNYFHAAVDFPAYQQGRPLEEEEMRERVERFLQKEVSGLGASYREVIDAFIGKGHRVCLRGGILRDLFGLSVDDPHDVDVNYTGTPEEIEQILNERGWRYVRLPGEKLLVIGDYHGCSIDALALPEGITMESFAQEFTINSMLYDCGARLFLRCSEEGLSDLLEDRCRIPAGDWNLWMQSGGWPSYKIFRFWKMIGRGYIYHGDLNDFFCKQTEAMLKGNEEQFFKDLFRFLMRNFYCFQDLYRGAVVSMGYEWAKGHILPLKDRIEEESLRWDWQKLCNSHNLYPSPRSALSPGGQCEHFSRVVGNEPVHSKGN